MLRKRVWSPLSERFFGGNEIGSDLLSENFSIYQIDLQFHSLEGQVFTYISLATIFLLNGSLNKFVIATISISSYLFTFVQNEFFENNNLSELYHIFSEFHNPLR